MFYKQNKAAQFNNCSYWYWKIWDQWQLLCHISVDGRCSTTLIWVYLRRQVDWKESVFATIFTSLSVPSRMCLKFVAFKMNYYLFMFIPNQYALLTTEPEPMPPSWRSERKLERMHILAIFSLNSSSFINKIYLLIVFEFIFNVVPTFISCLLTDKITTVLNY